MATDLKEMFDESGDVYNAKEADYIDDLGIKRHKTSKKIRFMRGYTDDGELIFDPFDPKAKKEDPGQVNYNKRFSKEMKQNHKLIREQQRYVDQLEKLFRATTGLGTANPRQLTKTDVELAGVLSQARGQLLQMIGGVTNLKKTIADLQLKQYAKLASDLIETSGVQSEDLRGAGVLSQILASGIANAPTAVNLDGLEDISSMDDDSLVGVDVRNENRDLRYVIIHDMGKSENKPAVLTDTGEIAEDVNIPSYMYDVDIYPTEGVAKDKMGHTFPLIMQ